MRYALHHLYMEFFECHSLHYIVAQFETYIHRLRRLLLREFAVVGGQTFLSGPYVFALQFHCLGLTHFSMLGTRYVVVSHVHICNQTYVCHISTSKM